MSRFGVLKACSISTITNGGADDEQTINPPLYPLDNGRFTTTAADSIALDVGSVLLESVHILRANASAARSIVIQDHAGTQTYFKVPYLAVSAGLSPLLVAPRNLGIEVRNGFRIEILIDTTGTEDSNNGGVFAVTFRLGTKRFSRPTKVSG